MNGLSRVLTQVQFAAVREVRKLSHWGICFLVFQIGAAVICVVFCAHLPSPEWAGAFLAFIAAIMGIHSEMRPWQRAFWMVLIGVLLIVQYRSIKSDRQAAEEKAMADRKAQDASFKNVLDAQAKDFSATAASLKQSYRQSESQFQATIGGISNEISTVTGGNSYAFVTLDLKYHELEFIHVGTFPIYSLYARVVDVSDADNDLMGQVVYVGDLIPDHGVSRPVPAALLHLKNPLNLNIFFTARNGDWVQVIRTRQIKNTWAFATLVSGGFYNQRHNGILCWNLPKGFPLTDNLNDRIFRIHSVSSPPNCFSPQGPPR